jgi:hypothetical protein
MSEMGYRARGYRGSYPGNGPFRDLAPWQRPGRINTTSVRVTHGSDTATCQTFPWLPRWWWAYSEKISEAPPSAEREKEIIERQISAAENHVAAMKKRLGELESGSKTG